MRVIAKVLRVYRFRKPRFNAFGGIPYDKHSCRISLDDVSLMTLRDRVKVSTLVVDYQRKHWTAKIRSEKKLIYRNGIFYLVVVQEVQEQLQYEPIGAIGIDFGVSNIIASSDMQVPKQVDGVRKRYSRLIKTLQHINTKSAFRKM
jgi:transposase